MGFATIIGYNNIILVGLVMVGISRKAQSTRAIHTFLIPILSMAVILLSIALFIVKGVLDITNWSDYYQWYAAGQMWRNGQDLYDYDLYRSELNNVVSLEEQFDPTHGYYYLPPSSMIFSLLAYLPLETGFSVFLAFEILSIVIMLALLGLVLSHRRSIGWMEVALLSILLATSFVRTSLRLSQISIFVGIFLFLSYWFHLRNQSIAGGLSLTLGMLKPLFLPVFGLHYLIQQKFRMMLVFIVGGMAFLLIPIWAKGQNLIEVMRGWLDTVIRYSGGGVNDPSPFSPISAYLLNLEPLVYRVLNSDGTIARTVGMVMVVAFTGVVLWAIASTSAEASDSLLDFSLISLLTLLIVYRRLYDGFLVFPALLYLYDFAMRRPKPWQKWLWAVLLAEMLIVFLLPGDLVNRLAYQHPQLLDSYLFRLVAPFQTWTVFLVFAILLFIKLTSIRSSIFTPKMVPNGEYHDQSNSRSMP